MSANLINILSVGLPCVANTAWSSDGRGNMIVNVELRFWGTPEMLDEQVAKFFLRGAKEVRDKKINWEKLLEG